MKSEEQDNLTVNAASQAMNRILEAERDAETGIAECRQAAQKIIQDAQHHAALINQRANERITVQHLRCKQEIERRISGLERTTANELRELHDSEWDDRELQRVIGEVAAALIHDASDG